jgi:hypothetical protein
LFIQPRIVAKKRAATPQKPPFPTFLASGPKTQVLPTSNFGNTATTPRTFLSRKTRILRATSKTFSHLRISFGQRHSAKINQFLSADWLPRSSGLQCHVKNPFQTFETSTLTFIPYANTKLAKTASKKKNASFNASVKRKCCANDFCL